MGREKTNEESGVEIVIPVKSDDFQEFYDKAVTLFKHFKVVPDVRPVEDCNSNGQEDVCDIMSGISEDTDLNGVPNLADPAQGCGHYAAWSPSTYPVVVCRGFTALGEADETLEQALAQAPGQATEETPGETLEALEEASEETPDETPAEQCEEGKMWFQKAGDDEYECHDVEE